MITQYEVQEFSSYGAGKRYLVEDNGDTVKVIKQLSHNYNGKNGAVTVTHRPDLATNDPYAGIKRKVLAEINSTKSGKIGIYNNNRSEYETELAKAIKKHESITEVV